MLTAIFGIILELVGWMLWAVCQATAGLLYSRESPTIRRFQRGAGICLLSGIALVVIGICLGLNRPGCIALLVGVAALLVAGYLGRVVEVMCQHAEFSEPVEHK